MQAGRLRHRVTIERLTGERGDAGGISDEWQVIGTRWASVKPLTGREWGQAAAANTRISQHLLTGMTRADTLTTTLTPRDRLRFKGRTLDIQAVMNTDERGQEMRIMCKERP